MGTTAKGYPYPEGTDLVVDGDDAIQALAEAVDTKLPYATATGAGSAPDTASNAGSNVTVTFPTGQFTAAPRVVLNPNTSAPQQRHLAAQSVTASSFSARYVNTGGTKAGVSFTWIAIQQEAAVAVFLAEGEEPTTAIVACTNSSCPYFGMEIEAIVAFVDDEGNIQTVDSIICGTCGTVLTPAGA